MPRYADLEIAFRKRDERSYALGFRFNGAGDEAEQRPEPDPIVAINVADLFGDDPALYGAKLADALFTPDVRILLGNFRMVAQQQEAILRVRLAIESSAPELHAVRWETLPDPAHRDTPLFVGERIAM